MLRNNADARRCSYFELGLPVVAPVLKILGVPKLPPGGSLCMGKRGTVPKNLAYLADFLSACKWGLNPIYTVWNKCTMYETNVWNKSGGIGKSIMVRVSARFELTTVPVIGSQQENVLTGEHAQQSSAFSSSSGGRYVHF